jgi:hypothetical protein
MADTTQKPVWLVDPVLTPSDRGYRAELWIRPYTGRMLAATETRTTKAAARKDGRLIFSKFTELP